MNTSLKIRSIAAACSFIAIGSVFDSPSVANAMPTTAVERETKVTDASYTYSQYSKAAMLAAKQNLRIVYLTSKKLTDQLSVGPVAVGALDKNASNQIIIVDSDYQDKDLLMLLMAKGNFIVSVGKTKINTTKSAAAMLEAIERNQKMKSAADIDADQSRMIGTTTSDGDTAMNVESVHAENYSPNGWDTFNSTEQDIELAIAEALIWASGSKSRILTAKASDDWGTYIRRVTGSATCNYKPFLGQTRVAGKINAIAEYYKKPNDGNNSYDWWYVKFKIESLPGYLLKSQGVDAHGQFRNNLIVNSANFDSNQYFVLLSYSPLTSQNPSTINVGLDSAGVGSIGWSYTLQDVSVAFQGDSSKNDVKWTHDVNTTTSSGRNTVTVEPGAMIRVAQDQGIYNQFAQSYSAQFYAYFYAYPTGSFVDLVCNVASVQQ